MQKINKKYISSRKVALDILYKIIYKKEFSNKLLFSLDKYYLLMEKDKNLIYQIVYGSLQNKIYITFLLKQFTTLSKLDKKIRLLLILSIYQLHFLDKIPPYAIVNEAVNIAKNVKVSQSKLVNAILNNFIKTKNIDKFLINSKLSEDEKLAIKYSIPEWISSIIIKYGEENLRKYAKNNLLKPKLSYRVNTNKISFNKFCLSFADRYVFLKSRVSKCGIISSKPLIHTSAFNNGLLIAQDEMAQKVSNYLEVKQDEWVLDMCAAPGGKTTHLSALMKNTGRIDAFEINKNKIPYFEDNIKRLDVKNIFLYNKDSLMHRPSFLYDKILLDPPCSGLGVIKRKPEIKYKNLNFIELNSLVKKQYLLLKKAYQLLKPGGILLYVTCTINKDENINQIQKILNLYNDLELLEEQQIFGYEENTDGFYYSKLLKTK